MSENLEGVDYHIQVRRIRISFRMTLRILRHHSPLSVPRLEVRASISLVLKTGVPTPRRITYRGRAWPSRC